VQRASHWSLLLYIQLCLYTRPPSSFSLKVCCPYFFSRSFAVTNLLLFTISFASVGVKFSAACSRSDFFIWYFFIW